jgi:hypothetical protein
MHHICSTSCINTHKPLIMYGYEQAFQSSLGKQSISQQFSLVFLFLVVLGFELRVSGLLGRGPIP